MDVVFAALEVDVVVDLWEEEWVALDVGYGLERVVGGVCDVVVAGGCDSGVAVEWPCGLRDAPRERAGACGGWR